MKRALLLIYSMALVILFSILKFRLNEVIYHAYSAGGIHAPGIVLWIHVLPGSILLISCATLIFLHQFFFVRLGLKANIIGGVIIFVMALAFYAWYAKTADFMHMPMYFE